MDSRPSLRFRVVALLCIVLLAATACPAREEPEPGVDEGDPVYGGSIIMGLEAESNSWLPGTATLASPGVNVAYAIYDPLMKRDADGIVRPYLAESMEPNDELTEWTLTLREGIKFHDGTPLNADALQDNFDNYLTVQGATTAGALRDVERVDVVDDLTVRYILNRGNAAFPDVLTGTPGMPFSPTAAQERGADAGLHPVGTGPFVFQAWRRDAELVVTRNDNYWQEGLPYLDQITFRPMPDEDRRLASLITGDVDAMHSLRQSIIAQARETPNIRRFEHIGNNGGGAIFNTARPPVDDVRVRQSLAWAIDQEAMVAVLGGEGITPPQTQYFSSDSPWYSERVTEQWPNNDPDRARELLEEYVSDPDRSDGKAPGSPVVIDFNCPPDRSPLELSQAYQSFWGPVGYQVNLHQVGQTTDIQDAVDGNYMVNCWRMGGEDDPYFTLSNEFGPPDHAPTNFTNFTHPDLDEQLEILRTETDTDVRFDAVEQIMLLFTEHVPNLWTGATATVVATRPELRNIAGWRFPDGRSGDGHPSAQVMWGHVWLAE